MAFTGCERVPMFTVPAMPLSSEQYTLFEAIDDLAEPPSGVQVEAPYWSGGPYPASPLLCDAEVAVLNAMAHGCREL